MCDFHWGNGGGSRLSHAYRGEDVVTEHTLVPNVAVWVAVHNLLKFQVHAYTACQSTRRLHYFLPWHTEFRQKDDL